MSFKLAFGGNRQPATYYTAVLSIITALQPIASLRTTAQALTDAGFTTPSGLPWDRTRLSSFIRTTAHAA